MPYLTLTGDAHRTVKEARRRSEWSREQLVRLAGVSLGTIRSIEAGRRHRFQEEVIVRVCSALNVALHSIVDEGVVTRSSAAMPASKVTRQIASTSGGSSTECGLFIAAPMATITRSYARHNASILALADAFEAERAFGRVYYAGRALARPSDFEDEATALRANLAALEAARRFLLVYPEPLPTSALVELGYAMARNLPVIVCIRDWAHVPYMLRAVSRVRANTAVVKYRTVADILPLCVQERWFVDGHS